MEVNAVGCPRNHKKTFGETMPYDVEVGAPAQLYVRNVPAGATAVGIIREKRTGATGALLRFKSGVYAQMNGSKIRPLDRREVIVAMSNALATASSISHTAIERAKTRGA
jgi:hypothetical protein